MNNFSIPTYKKIALDIAIKIQDNIIAEGDLLHGRSTLSSTYNVSPETIRRSIRLLEDVDVVKSIKGKGIVVLSRENAILFLTRNKSIDNVTKFKYEITSLMNDRTQLESKLLTAINGIIDYTSRFQESSIIIPHEFLVPEDCIHINKTFAELKFWQNTGATLIGIKRNGELLLSPGPYITILPNDVLIVVGDNSIIKSIPDFLSSN